jgi:hypothetical protein
LDPRDPEELDLRSRISYFIGLAALAFVLGVAILIASNLVLGLLMLTAVALALEQVRRDRRKLNALRRRRAYGATIGKEEQQ